jgi:mercuric reductase
MPRPLLLAKIQITVSVDVFGARDSRIERTPGGSEICELSKDRVMTESADERYDLVILDSGSTAFAAAIRAAELGKRAVMTEARTLGGTCVNRGCLPSKNLIEAAKLVHDAAHPRYPGLTPQRLPLNVRELVAQKDAVIHDYRDKKYQRITDEAENIDVLYGEAHFVSDHAIAVDGRRIEGERLLIATGSIPLIPAIAGLDQVPYLTSDLLTSNEPMELQELPQSLIVVGGGYIALELGQMFQRFGTAVTLLERGPQLLPRGYEPEVGHAIEEILRAEGVSVVTGATAQEVQRQGDSIGVTAVVHGQKQLFQAQRLLVATGRQPNSRQIGLEAAGVAVDAAGAVRVDAFLRTTVPHIFAAGDAIGREVDSQMATPVGARDGGIAAQNAFATGTDQLRRVDHRVIPRTIFTDPQIGIVGVTEQEAIAAGHNCWCNTVPMELVPRAGAIRDTRGLIKMVADNDTGEVLGVSMVGVQAGEVIHEAAMGMRFHATVNDFIDLLHVYPTMAEALKIVALSRYKDPAKLSCAE